MRLVSVVTRTRSPRAVRCAICSIRSSIWPRVGLTSISGSSRPVGRINCSAPKTLDRRPPPVASSVGAARPSAGGQAPLPIRESEEGRLRAQPRARDTAHRQFIWVGRGHVTRSGPAGPRTRGTSADGCRAPTAAGSRTRPAHPCAPVAVEHAAHLRDAHVRLVDEAQEVVREIVDQRPRRAARLAATDAASSSRPP